MLLLIKKSVALIIIIIIIIIIFVFLFIKSTSKGINVIQLETAAGAAMRNFKGAIGVNVPRRRFLPVKKTSDLLVVMSNLFTISDGGLRVNKKRSIGALPLVKLGDRHFQRVHKFNSAV